MSTNISSNDSPYDFFIARDGLPIRYGIWAHKGDRTAGTIVLLTGRREFLEKYADIIAGLQLRHFDVVGMDWRGQGLSGRQLANRHKGHVEDYRYYLDDLDDLIRDIVGPLAAWPPTVLAHSMGGHIALRYLHDHPDRVARAVLTAPMVDILPSVFSRKLLPPMVRMAVRIGLGQAYTVGTGDYDPSGQIFEKNRLTSDPNRFQIEQKLINANPDLALGGVTYAWLDRTFRSIAILTSDGYARNISPPVLMLTAEKDRIVSNPAQHTISSRMPNCVRKTIPNARHEILNETDAVRTLFWQEFDRFVP